MSTLFFFSASYVAQYSKSLFALLLHLIFCHLAGQLIFFSLLFFKFLRVLFFFYNKLLFFKCNILLILPKTIRYGYFQLSSLFSIDVSAVCLLPVLQRSFFHKYLSCCLFIFIIYFFYNLPLDFSLSQDKIG